LSVTSVESYVDWAEVEPEPGRWDWSKWDRQVATLEAARLRWVPFLIAGPAYATPRWFQHGSQSRFYRCLEHGQENRVQSLFNPDLPARVDAFLQAFAARYRDRGVIESVLLGVTGIYGESIYPAGPEGGWTTRLTGPYHNHAGWWAGDDHAIASFRAAMRRRYTSIEALNRAWGTAHGGFDAVVTFLPERAPNDRARVDFVEWYQDAMTQWAVTWVRAARRAFPSTEIYLCTGGDGLPMLGADFTAQAAAIAPERAGIRVTNEGSDYTANFSLTREVATATRLYGTFCGFEPASGVDARGVVARIYNATASGARQLHDYIPNTLGGDPQALAQFRSHIGWLVPRQPRIQAAVYLARESWAVEPRGVSQLQERARVLRDVTDIDFLTRRSVQDGHLSPYRLLVLADAPVLERRSAEAIEEWVKQGGTLIAADRPGIPLGSRLDDLASWRARLFASPDAAALGSLVRPELEGEAPPRWQLNVGSGGDQPWLVGRWHDRESAAEWVDQPHPTMRWSGPGSAILIPVRPGSPHEVRVHLSVRAEAVGQEGVRLRIGRDTLATIRKPGRSTATFTLTPERVGPGNVVRLDIAARVWRPADVDRGSDDRRPLGIAVHRVEVRRVPQPRTLPAEAAVRWTIDDAKLAACRRAVGRGTTFYLPGGAAEPHTLSLVAASQLVEPVDGRLDGHYATTTDRGTLWLDPVRPSISDQRLDGKEPGSAGLPGGRK
ncbi:MAG: alpha-amylase family protein, partial [Isosphaeraceae bacterium]